MSEIKKYLSKIGKKGAINRWANMTKEEKTVYGKKMAKARWDKEKLSTPNDLTT